MQVFWDIHNVLAKKDTGAKISAIIGNIFGIMWGKLGNSKAWQEIDALPKKDDISGEARYLIALKHKEYDLAHFIMKAANAYKPRKGMAQIVNEIHAKGITQQIASNIGPQFFDSLKKKFKKKKSAIFDRIQQGKVVDYSGYAKISTPAVPTDSTLCTVTKSHDLFFDQLLKTYKRHNNELCVMIDDNVDNIKRAQKRGMVGIYFDLSKKNPVKQLRADLKSLGILQ